MDKTFYFCIDTDPFERLGNALAQFAEAALPIFESMRLKITQELETMFPVSSPPVTERLELFGWRAVDARDLNPRERWEYQRWVWGAPMRKIRRLYARLRD